VESLTLYLQGLINGILNGGVYALIALGFTLVFGVLRVINFAHGHFVMVAMYISYVAFATLHIDPFLSLIAVIPLLFILGILVQRFFISRLIGAHETSHMALTIGLLIVLENFGILGFGGEFRGVTTAYSTSTIPLGDLLISVPRLMAFAVASVFVILLYFFLNRTDIGIAIRACAEEREGAMLVGINQQRVYVLTFGLGAVLAGIAGAIIIPFTTVNPLAGVDFVLKAFMIVVLGGVGSIPGALFGALIFGIAESFFAVSVSAHINRAILFTVLFAVVIIRPTGLFHGRTK
jgi:branched-chain amino acid transport system permease protein